MGSFRSPGLLPRTRLSAARLPPGLRVALEAALAAFAGLCLGYVVVSRGLMVALAIVCLVPFAAFVLRRPGNGLALAAGLIAVVPYWWTIGSNQLSIPRAALLVGAAGLVVGFARGVRVRWPDLALVGLAAVFVLSFDPALGVPRGILIETIAALGFYGLGRLAGTPATSRLVLWALAIGGGLGAITVLFEYFVTQAPLVSDSSQYGWQQDAVYIYRPGGVYGSPPGAVVALAMTTICALPLIGMERHWRRWAAIALFVLGTAGVILTFTRAGWIGFAAAAVAYAVLSADQVGRRAKALLGGALALGVVLLLALPSLSGTEVYQKGVNREGTLQAREGYWQLALPLAGDSPSHLVLGRGFSALLSGDSGGAIDLGLMAAPQVTISGTHNQYVKTVVEHGIVGLALLLAWLGGAFAIAARQARRSAGDVRRMSAALAAATASFMIDSLANDTFRDAQTIALVALIAGLGVTVGAVQRKRAGA